MTPRPKSKLLRWHFRVVAALVALAFVPGTLLNVSRASAATNSNCSLSQKLVPSCGVLAGAYVERRSNEDASSAFTNFEQRVGEKQQIVHYYHQGRELFPTPWEIKLANEGRSLLLSWKPEAGHTWAQVAAGASDGYIDQEAAYIKSHYQNPFYLIIHHEPENEVNDSSGSGYTATDYRAMYRHVVSRLRGDGVTNAVFVMCYMGAQTYVTRSWFDELWPGDGYVDWVAYDPYVTTGLNGQDGGFPWLLDAHWGSGFNGMYNWITKNHAGMPIMLAEWGVGEKPGDPSYKSQLFRSIPGDLANYPALKALVYFDKANADVAGDVQVDTSSTSLSGYRAMLQSLNQASVTPPSSGAPSGGGDPGTGGGSSDSSSTISFVAATTLDLNAEQFAPRIPSSVHAGDTLLMFVAQGVADPVLVPAGWVSAGQVRTNQHVTTVWRKTATAADAGSSVDLPGTGGYSKAAITVAAYRGVDPDRPVAEISGSAETGPAATEHSAPAIANDQNNAWMVNFWSDKDDTISGWTAPSTETQRAVALGDGSGRVNSLLTDSGSTVPIGETAQMTARADQGSVTATMWTIILRPQS